MKLRSRSSRKGGSRKRGPGKHTAASGSRGDGDAKAADEDEDSRTSGDSKSNDDDSPLDPQAAMLAAIKKRSGKSKSGKYELACRKSV